MQLVVFAVQINTMLCLPPHSFRKLHRLI